MPSSPLVELGAACDGQAWLAQQLDGTLTLTWTDNCSSMIAVRGNAVSGYRLRLHRMFYRAPLPIWRAVAAFIAAPDTAVRQTLRTYIQTHQHLIRSSAPQRALSRPLQPRGRYFDLEEILATLNEAYFANGVQAWITWSRRPPQRPRASIRLGSYHAPRRLIRIHRLLDQRYVPRYVVESVVFHEMLHQLIPRQRINGRWLVHPPAFRQREQHFPHYWQAKRWQHIHLMRLLHE